MKATLTTILILITLSGFSQFVNLDWKRQNVKAQCRHLELIYQSRDYLEYKTPSGYVAYEFTDRICTTSINCMDYLSGKQMILDREQNEWKRTGPDQWDYFVGDTKPIKVTADWCGGNVLFRYRW